MSVLALACLTLAALPQDPAARGLDVFVIAPKEAAAGEVIPIAVQVFGFQSFTQFAPLDGASVEVIQNHAVGRQEPARARTDAQGRAVLFLTATESPSEVSEPTQLVVSATWGDHTRTRELSFSLRRAPRLEVFVDRFMVPGQKIRAFVRATNAHQPISAAKLSFELLDQNFVRARKIAWTDASGLASVDLQIPAVFDETDLELRTVLVETGREVAETRRALTLREETPGKPQLKLTLEESTVRPGDRAKLIIEAHDAAAEPVANVSVTLCLAPEPSPPKAPKDCHSLETNAEGRAEHTESLPKTIPRRGLTLVAEAKAELDGYPLRAQTQIILENRSELTLDLLPEAGSIVPGVRQDMTLSLSDGNGPVSALLHVEADGLDARVTTDARGRATLSWSAPKTLGSRHAGGDCAGDVAATVVVTTGPEKLRACVRVDRDAAGFVRVTPTVVRAGESFRVETIGAVGERLVSLDTTPPVVGFGSSLELSAPSAFSGTVRVESRASGDRKAVLPASILVRPPTFSVLSVELGESRKAPGGFLRVIAKLTDEAGKPLRGTVGARIIDAKSGLRSDLDALDEKNRLTSFADPDDRDALLAGRLAPGFVRGLLFDAQGGHFEVFDPTLDLDTRRADVFRKVVRQLEGALYEASGSPDRLIDARTLTNGRSTFNPELFSIVTQGLEEAPETPGGEPLALSDLVNMDSGVTYDNVGRRVTRLKIFRTWSKVREYLLENRATIGEPILEDPNAILRVLVREEKLEPDELLDAWGSSISFVPAGNRRGLPFSLIAKHILTSPGPDGRVGTGDDLCDPFQRVLPSGSPYAKAVDEDQLVDARDGVLIGESVVEAWRSAIEASTGDQFGESFEGLGGFGSGGGGGMGSGSARATVQGRGLRDRGTDSMLGPFATDDAGRVEFLVPLERRETTWKLVVVGFPVGAPIVVSSLEVPIALPISISAPEQRAWHLGDEGLVTLQIRNRLDRPVTARIRVAVSGAEAIGPSGLEARVAAQSRSVVPVRVRAPRVGFAELKATVEAEDLRDEMTQRWSVEATSSSELVSISKSLVMHQTLELPEVEQTSAPRLILSRGFSSVFRRALEVRAPPATMLELAGWILRGTSDREESLRAQATAMRDESAKALASESLSWIERWKTKRFSAATRASECPPDSEQLDTVPQLVEAVGAEPDPVGVVVKSCWDTIVTNAMTKTSPGDLESVARLVIALSEKPHRREAALHLGRSLRAVMRSGSTLSLASDDLGTEALVRAAISRLDDLEGIDTDQRSLLVTKQDARGTFGSIEATRWVLRALTATQRADLQATECEVLLRDPSGQLMSLAVSRDSETAATFGRGARSIQIVDVKPPDCRPRGRFEVTTGRPWSSAPASRYSFVVEWPREWTRNQKAVIRVRAALPKGTAAQVKIPLPPGARLDADAAGVRQIEGKIWFDAKGSEAEIFREIPILFTMTGRFSVPEAEAKVTGQVETTLRAKSVIVSVKEPS